jgi:hypothetical protein
VPLPLPLVLLPPLLGSLPEVLGVDGTVKSCADVVVPLVADATVGVVVVVDPLAPELPVVGSVVAGPVVVGSVVAVEVPLAPELPVVGSVVAGLVVVGSVVAVEVPLVEVPLVDVPPVEAVPVPDVVDGAMKLMPLDDPVVEVPTFRLPEGIAALSLVAAAPSVANNPEL